MMPDESREYPVRPIPVPDIALLLARSEIHDVLVSYCQAVDRRDWNAVLSCYHEDAIDDHGELSGSPADLVGWMQENHKHVTSCMHVLSNVWIRVSEDDPSLALSESYCVSYKAVASADHDPFLHGSSTVGPVRRAVGCRYVDTWRHRIGSGWRIQHRKLIVEWVRAEPQDAFLESGPHVLVSRRDPNDALYGPLITG